MQFYVVHRSVLRRRIKVFLGTTELIYRSIPLSLLVTSIAQIQFIQHGVEMFHTEKLARYWTPTKDGRKCSHVKYAHNRN